MSGSARLTMVGLIATGLGFVGAGINPGPGPRVVRGALTVGSLYLPPLLVGVVALVLVALVAARLRWMPAVGGAFAAILLIGTATFGWAAVSYRLTHPTAVVGFAEDCLQLAGEALAVGAVLAVSVDAGRRPAVKRMAPASRRPGGAPGHG
jgi:hypothetical protein